MCWHSFLAALFFLSSSSRVLRRPLMFASRPTDAFSYSENVPGWPEFKGFLQAVWCPLCVRSELWMPFCTHINPARCPVRWRCNATRTPRMTRRQRYGHVWRGGENGGSMQPTQQQQQQHQHRVAICYYNAAERQRFSKTTDRRPPPPNRNRATSPQVCAHLLQKQLLLCSVMVFGSVAICTDQSAKHSDAP